jgi:Arc/MetJ-type ribon-helix-helix transcriptional regulator
MPRKLVTLKVRLPKKLLGTVKRKLKREAYASASEYVAELIRKDLHEAIANAPPGDRSANGGAVDRALWRQLHGAAIGDGDHRGNGPKKRAAHEAGTVTEAGAKDSEA